jgi:3-dehydroquinate synthase
VERNTIAVRWGGGSYPVIIEAGLLGGGGLPSLIEALAPARHYAVISDSNVAPLYAQGVAEALVASGMAASLHFFPAGEAHKNRESWARLTDGMVEAGAGRDAAVLAVGGGVTGDLAGFVAATYMRGIPVVQLPTSLVAMIDSSVGGKTGVDVPGGKNLVGAFHPPRGVLVDPWVLHTLPRAERARGLAEAAKHGAIRDLAYLERILEVAPALLDGDPGASAEVVEGSVRLKRDVVQRDERETGERRILNFGHTLAHALESVSRFGVPHGDAVAIGMVLEARLGERRGVTLAGTADRLTSVLRALELPVALPAGVDPVALVEATRSDKKAASGAVRYVLLRTVGEVDPGDGSWVHSVPDAEVLELLRTLS